jgi:hypothetical protein
LAAPVSPTHIPYWKTGARTEAEIKVLDKKTLQRIQDIEKLPDEERKVIYKVLDSLLRNAEAKHGYA